MKHLEIKTQTTVNTTVSIDGVPVESFLREVCNLAHIALMELSAYRIEHKLPEDEFDTIEGPFCSLLEKLGD